MGGGWEARFFPLEKNHFFAFEQTWVCQEVHEIRALGPPTSGDPPSTQDPSNVFISHTSLTIFRRNLSKSFLLKECPSNYLNSRVHKTRICPCLWDDIVDKHFLRSSKYLYHTLGPQNMAFLSFTALKLTGPSWIGS